MKLYPRRNRILCPECKGEKEKLYDDGEYGERVSRTCKLCEGEGIVIEKVTVEYETIK
ncbi:MAG: hypothetical protein ABFD50_10520 [Smithella sp.]